MTYSELTNASGHILIAGATGSGKSVFLNGLVNSALRQGRFMFIAIDPKKVELSHLKGVRTCLRYADDERGAVSALRFAVAVMQARYDAMQEQGRKRSGDSDLLIVIDELADLLICPAHKEIELLLQKIAQLGRAAGVRLVMATQCPNRQILKASIILNINIRVALRCNSAIESRQILGEAGAEQLAPYGQAIIKNGVNCEVVNVPMVSEQETADAVAKSNALNIGFKPIKETKAREGGKPPIPIFLITLMALLIYNLICGL